MKNVGLRWYMILFWFCFVPKYSVRQLKFDAITIAHGWVCKEVAAVKIQRLNTSKSNKRYVRKKGRLKLEVKHGNQTFKTVEINVNCEPNQKNYHYGMNKFADRFFVICAYSQNFTPPLEILDPPMSTWRWSQMKHKQHFLEIKTKQ